MNQNNRSGFDDDDELEAQASDFKPLTAEEAQRLREKHPSISPWRVVAGQILVGLVVAAAAWGLTGRRSVGWSALYGALAVVIPAALFARGIGRQASAANPGAAVLRFFGWEIVKIILTVAMLVAAPRVVAGLNWLALLAGMVLAMKAYWIAFWVRSRSVATKD